MRTTRSTRTRRRLAHATGALGLGLVLGAGLTACGDDTGAESRTVEVSTTEHNDADVAFASDMIQHHAQALSMVDLTLDRPLDPEVQALAEEVRAAQAPEIETMADWLVAWGEEVPETMRDHVNSGHDMDDMSDDMSDTMSDGVDDMDALESAPDEEFQALWLEMMIEHHEGAVELARTEQTEGRFKDAVDLAGQVEQLQTTQIDTMEGLLGS